MDPAHGSREPLAGPGGWRARLVALRDRIMHLRHGTDGETFERLYMVETLLERAIVTIRL